MRYFIISILIFLSLIQNAWATELTLEQPTTAITIPANSKDLFTIEKKEEVIHIQCQEQKDETKPIWYFIAGSALATLTWGFFYYERNKK